MIVSLIQKMILENSWGKNQPTAIILGINEAAALKLELNEIQRQNEKLEDYDDQFLFGCFLFYKETPGITIAFGSAKQAIERLYKKGSNGRVFNF